MRRTVIIALSALALACHIGPRTDDIEVAHQPGGASITITARSGTVLDGELLAESDSGLVMLWAGQVGYIPYAQTSKFKAQTIEVSTAAAQPSAADRERLRLMSRFPQGLTPDLETRLLAALHQKTVVVLAR